MQRKSNSPTNTLRWGALALALVAFPLLAGSACDPDIEEDLDARSSTDKTREGAVEISLNATVVDNVSTERYDKTDWKYFSVPAPGIIEIIVSFDQPKAYGEMIVTDQVGQVVSTFQDEKKALLDKVTFKAEASIYYLQFFVNSVGSDYSVQVNYSPL